MFYGSVEWEDHGDGFDIFMKTTPIPFYKPLNAPLLTSTTQDPFALLPSIVAFVEVEGCALCCTWVE